MHYCYGEGFSVSETTLIDICIATCLRPRKLEKLLHSLLRQQVEPTVEYRIVVIDNDAEGSARPIVDSVRGSSSVDIAYEIEPVRNVSLTRNRAIANAVGEYVAFIDDDEYATAGWLQALLDTLIKYEADVVFGPVIAEYPENTPYWVKQGRFFERGRQKTGGNSKHRASGNVLIKRSILLQMTQHFLPEFGRIGGEDTEFFFRMHKNNARMIWCDSAIVYEPVDRARMNAVWLGRRAFRCGQIFRRVYVDDENFSVKLRWGTIKSAFLIATASALPITFLAGRVTTIKAMQRLLDSAGYFVGLPTEPPDKGI